MMRGTRRIRRTVVFASLYLMATVGALPESSPAGTAAECGPADRAEPGLQGQVPLLERLNGNAADGYWCNLQLLGSFRSRSFANFDTYKNCAYYTDNVGFLPGSEGGGVVLDVSDPEHPVKTAYLTARAMGNGGEALRVNQTRGLLAVAYYNIFSPLEQLARRWLAVYSVAQDCAHPTLLADVELPTAVGHGGCFQPDGMVFYMTSGWTITPIDLTDPAHPKQLSEPWPIPTHICSISDDGKRGYFADTFGSMRIVDTSQAQARVPGAQPRVISTFETPLEAQEETVPVWYGDHPYVLLWTEVRVPPKVCIPGRPTFGIPRIIDIADESHPVLASTIETEVALAENCVKVIGDASAQTSGLAKGDPVYSIATSFFLYDSHECTPDRLHDPTILACASLGSGLRVWDIRDPKKPREIAYYNAGTVSRTNPTLDWAFARAVIRRDLGQVWWVTHLTGFRAAKFRDGVWPFPGDDPCPPGYDYFRAQYDLVYQACKA